MMSSSVLPIGPSDSSTSQPTNNSHNTDHDENTPLLSTKAGSEELSVSDNKSSADSSENDPFSFSQLSARSKLILFLCSISNLFVSCSFSILAPFFPKEAEKKGLSTTTIGLIFSVFELVIFVSSPILGNYLTRLGTKFVLLSGICVGGCCSILFGTLDKSPGGVTFAAICFACRTLEALAMSAFMTASFAVLSTEFPRNVATVLGISETAAGIGMMVGPAFGGVLYELNGYGLPFFVLGSLLIVCGLVLGVLLPEMDDEGAKRKGSVWALIASPMTLISLLSVALCALGLSFLDPVLAKHLDPFHLSTALVGLVFVVGPALYAFCSPLWGYLVDHRNWIGLLIVPGHLFFGLSFFLVGPTPWVPFLPSKLWLVIVSVCLLGLSIGCIAVPNFKCMVIGAMDVGFEDNLDTYALVSGLFTSVFSLGGFVGPTLGGVMVSQMGFNLSASILGVVNVVTSLIALAYFLRRHILTKRREAASGKPYEYVNGQGCTAVTEDHIQGQDNYNV